MKRYINCKPDGRTVETVDELNSEDFSTLKEFRIESRRLLGEYRMAFQCEVWSSNRSTSEWRMIR